MTDLLRFYPLERGPEKWAEMVVQMRRRMPARPQSAEDPAFAGIVDAFTQKGYNSAVEIRRLEKLLEEACR